MALTARLGRRPQRQECCARLGLALRLGVRKSGSELPHSKVLIEAGEEAGGAVAVGFVFAAELGEEEGFFGADALD
jgi:hypothetical protein